MSLLKNAAVISCASIKFGCFFKQAYTHTDFLPKVNFNAHYLFSHLVPDVTTDFLLPLYSLKTPFNPFRLWIITVSSFMIRDKSSDKYGKAAPTVFMLSHLKFDWLLKRCFSYHLFFFMAAVMTQETVQSYHR